MMDPIVQQLLEQAIDSPVKLHLLLMFHENPRLEASPRMIAERVCRDIWSVAQALHELSEDGIMFRALTVHGDPMYRYAPMSEHIDAIARLLSRYDDPLQRDQLQRSIRDLAVYAPYRRANTWECQVA